MPYDSRELLKKHDALKNKRAVEEPVWRELAVLLRPDDNEFSAQEVRNRRDDEDQFDSTPLYALDSFTGGLFSQSTNPATRWFELTIEGDEDLAKYHPVAQWLYRRTNQLYGSMAPAVSNFYARVPTWFANTGAFGFGPLYQEEWLGKQFIVDMPIPIGQTYLDRDLAGNFNKMHREFKLSGDKTIQLFGPHQNVREDYDYTIVHAVCENEEYDPGKLDWRGMPWTSYHCSPDLKDLHKVGGYFEFPYHITAWNERATSAYPNGPGSNVRADGNMLQEMERTHLLTAMQIADPILLAHSKDIVSVADLVPGNILYGAMTEAGKRKVEYLENKGQIQLSLAMSEQRRQAIRTGFYFSMMQIIAQRPQMTATEFLGFKEEDLKLMAPHLVKIQGALSTFIARRYRILERAGLFADDPAPPELTRRRLAVKYVSPLARLMEVARGRGVLQYQAALEQMAVTDPSVRDWFNGDAAAPIVRQAFTEVPDVMRDPREVQQIRQARTQAAQQQIGLDQAGQTIDMAAEISHAQQAQTLANQRRLQ